MSNMRLKHSTIRMSLLKYSSKAGRALHGALGTEQYQYRAPQAPKVRNTNYSNKQCPEFLSKSVSLKQMA